MGKQLGYDFIKKEFQKNGLKLLEEKYFDNNTPMLCRDECGYLGYVKYSNLQFGKKFKPFSKRNPNAMYNLNLFFKRNNLSSQMLFTTMPDSKERVLFKCKCGEIFYCDLGHILNRGICQCLNCATKNRGIKKRIKNKDVLEFLRENGYTMLQDCYENNSAYIEVENSDGYRGFVTYNGLKTENKQMSKFNMRVNEKYFIYNLNIFCKNNKIKAAANKIVNKTSVNESVVEFTCECGEKFYTTSGRFMFGGKNKCDVCSKRLSSYEIKVMNWLNKHEINFIYQKKYNDCRNIIPLPFDFFLINFNILIEVDGEGHFFPVRYNGIPEYIAIENFGKTKYNDNIKNKYCLTNDIQLIRIPYYDINNKLYQEILKDNLLERK